MIVGMIFWQQCYKTARMRDKSSLVEIISLDMLGLIKWIIKPRPLLAMLILCWACECNLSAALISNSSAWAVTPQLVRQNLADADCKPHL